MRTIEKHRGGGSGHVVQKSENFDEWLLNKINDIIQLMMMIMLRVLVTINTFLHGALCQGLMKSQV